MSSPGSDADPAPALSDAGELLLRQVHPSWVEDGVPSSQAFIPTRKDEGQLSMARGSMTTAEAAYKHYVTVLEKQSAGTWAVTVGEVLAVELAAYDDPQPDIPAHAFVDFRDLGRGLSERKGKLLAARAKARGRLYP